uniref:SAUR family protein n=1 Tax=Solanum tuberosum TaxID=4113 RepID=M1CQB6_SOLTU
MGKERSNSCIVMLKIIMRKFKNNEVVPNDVKEGHFAVFSVNPEEEPKKFIVELHWLNNPLFLKLLKQAEDEYGFQQKGILEVPCRAAELQKILELKIG